VSQELAYLQRIRVLHPQILGRTYTATSSET
jgi:hypothetical protein